MSEKAQSFNKSCSEKFPRVHKVSSKCAGYVKEVWQETFPNEKSKVKSKMQKRKEVAKMQKEMEMSMEEEAQIQGEIPEWKRQAIVTTDQ